MQRGHAAWGHGCEAWARSMKAEYVDIRTCNMDKQLGDWTWRPDMGHAHDA
jgi:hypothetical protein